MNKALRYSPAVILSAYAVTVLALLGRTPLWLDELQQFRDAGRHTYWQVIDWVLARGGDGIRSGLADNIRLDRHRLAASNAELVRLACDALARHDCRPATPIEARDALGLVLEAAT